MKISRLVLLAAVFLANSFHSSFAGELQERSRIEENAKMNFAARNFARLESDSNAYRRDKSRTSSGIWKLTVFYWGISDALEVRGDANRPDANFQELESSVKSWLVKFPNSPTANIAYAMLLHNRGWAFRGENYAPRVKAEAWAPFRKYVAAAQAHMVATKAIAAVDPKWYEFMLWVGRAQEWDRKEFDQVFSEAINREPLFYQTYFAALEYLLPKWHGSALEIEKFAQNAVKMTKTAEGKGLYARIYWFASQTQYGNELFMNTRASWPQMKGAFEDVISRYPDAWNLNNYAKFACLAGDKEKTAELIRRTEPEVIQEVWAGARNACKTFALQT